MSEARGGLRLRRGGAELAEAGKRARRAAIPRSQGEVAAGGPGESSTQSQIVAHRLICSARRPGGAWFAHPKAENQAWRKSRDPDRIGCEPRYAISGGSSNLSSTRKGMQSEEETHQNCCGSGSCSDVDGRFRCHQWLLCQRRVLPEDAWLLLSFEEG